MFGGNNRLNFSFFFPRVSFLEISRKDSAAGAILSEKGYSTRRLFHQEQVSPEGKQTVIKI